MTMTAYVKTTGVVFGLLTAVHLWRITVEPQLATDAPYLLITAAAAVLCFWAWRALKTSARP
jgi:hypothetical protein